MRASVLFLAVVMTLAAGPALAQPWDWCWDQDVVTATVEGSNIRILHTAALYNCCPDMIFYTVDIPEPGTLHVTETEVNPQCTCLCCYNLVCGIYDVPAGSYLIDFEWEDMEHGTTHVYLEVTVPDLGQGGQMIAGPGTMSACLQGADAEDRQNPVVAGGTVALLPARPNPAAAGTTFSFVTRTAARCDLAVFTAAGVRVRTLLDEECGPGMRQVAWDGADDAGRQLPGGVYFCRLTGDGGVATRPVVLVR